MAYTYIIYANSHNITVPYSTNPNPRFITNVGYDDYVYMLARINNRLL
jgi:hypothetical protein